MKLCLIAAAFGCLALTSEPAQAQDARLPDDTQSTPGFSFWGTGSGSYFYHRLSGDCDTVDHGHGRNAAWGRWRMPLAQITEDGPEEGQHGGVLLRFRCTDGSDCMVRGHLTNITGRVSEHAIPFETMDRARAFSRQVAELRTACAAGT